MNLGFPWTLLGWLETLGLFMMLTFFFFACCSYCCEHRKSDRGAVLVEPNPNMIVVHKTEGTTGGRVRREDQQKLKTWREEHLRSVRNSTTNQPNYFCGGFSPVIFDNSNQSNGVAAGESPCSTQFAQQTPCTSIPPSLPNSGSYQNYTQQEPKAPVNVNDDPAPPYPGPPPGESCL